MFNEKLKQAALLILGFLLFVPNAHALQIGYDDGTFEGGDWRYSSEAYMVKFSLPTVGTYTLESVDVFIWLAQDSGNTINLIAFDEDQNKISALPDTPMGITHSTPGWYSYDIADILVSSDFYVGFYNSGTVSRSFLGVSFTTPPAPSGRSFLLTGANTSATSDDNWLQNFNSDYGIRVNVSKNSVPEPSSILLLGSGLLGLVALKRRNKS